MSTTIVPPVIRVFLSSTFADMQNERSYFNTFIQPKLSEMCARRGISFFSVDLRWGITEEDQMDGKVLPICLSEIDKCRPYFIGIIGNRYGSVVHEITESMKKAIPWLTGKEGKSITELEMLYGVLDEEIQTKSQNCAFYLRDSQLSDVFFPQTEPESDALVKLKKTVECNTHIRSAVYSSIEQFGILILKDFEHWLDQEYPFASVATDARKHWYNVEFRRNYIDCSEMRVFLDYYLSHDQKPLMLYGEGKRGKTAFLTNWALDQTRCILVNCQSDTVFHYWPSIAFEIVKEMKKLEPDTSEPFFNMPASSLFSLFGCGRDWLQKEDKSGNGIVEDLGRNERFIVTDQERDSFRADFVNWMSNLSFANPVYIVINDLEMLDDGEARFLTWLPTVLPDGVHLICSCNDLDIIDNAQTLGWNTKEMPLFIEASAEEYLDRCLKDYGKNLNDGQKKAIITSPLARYPGCLKYVISFLNRFGAFDNLSEIISQIHIFSDMSAMYSYSYGIMLASFTQEEQALFLKLLTFMQCNSNALSEQDYYTLLSANVPVSAILWSRFRNLLEQLDVVKGEYWKINDPDLRKFIDTMKIDVCATESALGEFYLDRLKEKKTLQTLDMIRFGTENANFAIHHLKASQNAVLLAKGLMDKKVLFYLCKVDWHIERAGWMHLVLHSDLDVPALIKQVILDNQDRERDDNLICRRLAQLIPNLEYRELASSFSEMIGQPVCGELAAEDPRRLSPAFCSVYFQICDQMKAGQFQRVIQQTEQFLTDRSDLSYREKTLLLKIKGESEDRLKLKENRLQTCAEFYFSAVRTADLKLISEALHQYCYSAYYMEDYETAKRFLKKAKKIALLNGNITVYLSVCNVDGMCNYRLHEFSVALHLFESCVNIWKKVGNESEAASVCLNICNLYYEKGDTKRAISFAKEVVEQLKNSPSERARARIPDFLNNIGLYQIEDMDDEGEKTLLQVLENLKGDSYSITAANATIGLARFYKKKDFTVKAAECYELAADTLFNLGDYKKTVYALQNAFECLERGGFVEQFRQVYDKWETMFGEVPNGVAYFRREMQYSVVDMIQIKALEEQLVIARADGNLQKEAELNIEIAQLWLFGDRKKALLCFAEAAKIYRRINEEESFIRTVEEGTCWLIRSTSPDEESLTRFVSLLPFEEQEMVARWKRLRCISEELQKRYDSHLQWEYQELTQTLLVPGRRVLSVSILSEQLESVLLYCSSDTVESLFNLASKDPKTNRVLCVSACRIDHVADHKKLESEYIGDKPNRLLQKMWNLIVLLQLEEENEKAAAVSGNLALIYRRREEKELTFFYHKKSIELYQKVGNRHDCLIEKLNLATAYRDFDALPNAITLLRDALRDAQESKDQVMCGLIAGNLAALLSQHNEYAASDDEILRLFETEERILTDGKEYRATVISLNNQIIFLLRLSVPDCELIEEKLVKAKNYIDVYRLKEFEKQISKLEKLFAEKKTRATAVKDKEIIEPKLEKDRESLQKKDSWLQRFLGWKKKE